MKIPDLLFHVIPENEIALARRCASLILLFFTVSSLHAQIDYAPNFPTPNAAELGKYGEIPVDLFNGLPQIDIPIYTIDNNDIRIPINLSYHASGIKTEEHPTWVGLGWSLSCGGSITRVVKGIPDETVKQDIEHHTGIGFDNAEFGNFYASSLNSGTDWSSLIGFQKFFGTSQLDYKGYLDGEPDEFLLNAPGISATFYFYRDGQNNLNVALKSKDGKKLLVEAQFYPNLSVDFYPDAHFSGTEQLYNPFFKFTITTDNGTKYTFGGTADAIDFNTTLVQGYFSALPTTWYLTEIASVNNNKVNFNYKREGNPVTLNKVVTKLYTGITGTGQGGCVSGCAGPAAGLLFAIQHPVYLSEVTGSAGVRIQFMTSKASDLSYNIDPNTFISYFGQDTHFRERLTAPYNFWLKLDKIVVNGIKSMVFNYTENINERLKLNSLIFQDINNSPISQYSFNYNTTKVAAYNTKRSDNWGYYNNKNYEGVNFDLLYNYRSPDTALMKAEVLTSIVYPTGGRTTFEYEAHSYGKIATQFPLFQINTSAGIAGGLRIKHVISQDGNPTNPPVTKEYTYLNADNSSSGILSGIPVYNATGRSHVQYSVSSWQGLSSYRESADYDQAYAIQSENFLNALGNTNGNHVTYSCVTVTMPGAGKTVYKYTNHDQFPDQAPENLYTNVDDRTLTDDFTSRELERGLLTSEETYNSGNDLIGQVLYEYNSSADRYNSFVKSISRNVINMPQGVPFVRMDATRIYTFYPYLQKKTSKQILNGLAITQAESYEYDDHNNLIAKTTTDSKNQTFKETYKYPYNYSFSSLVTVPGNQHAFRQLLSRNMTSVPVETVYSKVVGSADNTLKATFTDYGRFVMNGNADTILAPAKVYSLSNLSALTNFSPSAVTVTSGSPYKDQLTLDSRYELRENLIRYDNHGNLLGLKTEKGRTDNYLWDYNAQYPVMEVKNCPEAGAAYTSFETGDKGNWNYAGTTASDNTAPTGVKAYSLSGGAISKADLESTRTYVLTYWVKGAETPSISGGTVVATRTGVIRTYHGWTQYRHVFSGAASLTMSGGVTVDELRLYPEEALMTTYTYDPLIGVTSKTDEKGEVSYYEYDSFQRLKAVRDLDGNLLETYCYNYQGQLVDCNHPDEPGNPGDPDDPEEPEDPGDPGWPESTVVQAYFSPTLVTACETTSILSYFLKEIPGKQYLFLDAALTVAAPAGYYRLVSGGGLNSIKADGELVPVHPPHACP